MRCEPVSIFNQNRMLKRFKRYYLESFDDMPCIGNHFELMLPHEGTTSVIVTSWHSCHHLCQILKTLAVHLLLIEWNQFYLVITFQDCFSFSCCCFAHVSPFPYSPPSFSTIPSRPSNALSPLVEK